MATPAVAMGSTARTAGTTPDENVPTGKFVAPPLPTERQAAWGLRALGLFSLPFCAVGLGAGGRALARGLAGDWPQAAFSGLFFLVFGGAGGGLLGAALVGRRKLGAVIARAHAHPDEPWLWREDWAAKRVLDAAPSRMWTRIAFAALWNLIATPVSIAVVHEALTKRNHLALVALVFPLAGIILVVAAVRSTLQYRRFGISSLDLERVPVPVGHRLVGTVRASLGTPPPTDFRVVLSCINRTTTGTGDDQTTSERIRWQEERCVPGSALRDYRGPGTTIPVDFAIPADAHGTDEARPRDAIFWRLSVSAALAGVDYASAFDVPVYYTQESAAPEPPDAAGRFSSPAIPDPPAVPSSITIGRDGDATAIAVPAFRNPGPTLGLAAFALLWTGTICLQRWVHAPLLFPAITSLFAFFLWWGVLAMAFGTSRTVVRRDGVDVTYRLLGIPSHRRVDAADVTGIEMPIQMQTGTTPYYSVLVRRRAIPGRRLAGAVTVASGVRDKR